MELLYKWVSPGILIDIEDIDDPVDAYKHIKTQYAVTSHRSREQTLEKISALSLTTSDNMADYLNQHRQHRADLKKLEYSYSDNQWYQTFSLDSHHPIEPSRNNTTGSVRRTQTKNTISPFSSTVSLLKKKIKKTRRRNAKPIKRTPSLKRKAKATNLKMIAAT
ncbi:hypothetical protein VC83_00366 [Pseudogymnoascus destructans]|uniref:Uncharacterized protein n=1 Tax=Pseudogymnoascus destructans TaxID=655981 RepID=A0A177ANH2_9PEZI|nr:uncharacterized protein VC83_00366 [Pseudogymnoascus destructans]OAF62833.1 hypothetical protein VC83_00366 [Pseudogymnoascus destructans]